MSGLDFRATLTSRHCTASPIDHALRRQHAIFTSPCRFDHSMSVVNVNYIYQGLKGTRLIVGSHPAIKNMQIDLAEVTRCTLSVRCSSDLDYCTVLVDRAEVTRCTLSVRCSSNLDYRVVFIDRVAVFLEHVHRTSKLPNGLRQTSPSSVFILLVFWLS